MNATLTVILFVSLALNVLSLRWALQEHAGRRQWQQEAAVLAHTLRSLGDGEAEPREGSLLPWLIAGLLAGGLLFMGWILLNVTGL